MSELCEKTVRVCIEALHNVETPYGDGVKLSNYEAVQILEALLPDPAEELVREYRRQSKGLFYESFEDFARWLTQNYSLEKK